MNRESVPFGRFERILVATDGTYHTAAAERIALELAGTFDGTLTAVGTILSDPGSRIAAPDVFFAAEDATHAALDRLRAQAEARGIAMTQIVRCGPDLHDEITSAAEEQHSDLVVIGRQGKATFFRRLLGDTTADVLDKAKCEVIVVPPAARVWQKRVLLATHSSHFSEAAIVSAGRIAAKYGLRITVLAALAESVDGLHVTTAENALKGVYERLGNQGLGVETQVLRGNPAQLIVQTAMARGADLTILDLWEQADRNHLFSRGTTQRVVCALAHPVIVTSGYKCCAML